MLYKRRPEMESTAKCKVPEFVRRLEEGLYAAAPDRASYIDPATVEARAQRLARFLIRQQQAAAVVKARGM